MWQLRHHGKTAHGTVMSATRTGRGHSVGGGTRPTLEYPLSRSPWLVIPISGSSSCFCCGSARHFHTIQSWMPDKI